MNDPQQIEMFPTVLPLRRTDPEGAVRRFYLVTVQPDLFGGAALVAESGSGWMQEGIDDLRKKSPNFPTGR